MSTRNPTRSRTIRARSGAAGLAVALLGAIGAPAAFGADAEATEPAQPPRMSVEFTQRAASVVGSRALVRVKCVGSEEWGCVGTLLVRSPKGSHKIPYSIQPEEPQTVVVPLGSDGTEYDRLASLRAVAQTVQPTGGLIATSRQLSIR